MSNTIKITAVDLKVNDFLPQQAGTGATVKSISNGTEDNEGKLVIELVGHMSNQKTTVVWDPTREVLRHPQGS